MLLKRLFFAFCVASLLLASGLAHASIQVGDKIYFTDGPGSPGGEFGVYMVGTTAPRLFTTFCVETNEYLDFSTEGFNVVGITKEAVLGGTGGGSPDPLSAESAWLYSQFNHGTLLGYDGSAAKANALQQAIWYFENESEGVNNDYVTLAIAASDADKAAALARVFVLNLTWATSRSGHEEGEYAQDVLYEVPEPMSLAVWGGLGLFGLVGLAVRRRVAS